MRCFSLALRKNEETDSLSGDETDATDAKLTSALRREPTRRGRVRRETLHSALIHKTDFGTH